MDNTAEYERIFNMTIEERRKLLKEKDQDFKKEYFAYDNRERARRRREAKKTDENKQPIDNGVPDDIVKKVLNTPIQTDMELGKDGKLFKAKVDDFFKQILPKEDQHVKEIIKEEDQPVKEIIKEEVKPDIKQQIKPRQAPKQTKPKEEPVKLQAIKEDEEILPDNTTFYQNVIYADTIIAKSYITDDGDDGETGISISNIKNYNFKIPISYLDDIYINLPSNSKMICDTQYIYIFLN